MAKETVLIGCRLPHGLILHSPDKSVTVTIKGMNSSKIIGATYTTTPVEAEFWAAWKKSMVDYQPLRVGAIFEATSDDQAKYKGKELSKEKTGFEPLKPDAVGVKPDKDAKG